MTTTLPERPATTEPEHHQGTLTIVSPDDISPLVHHWDTRELGTVQEARTLFRTHALLYRGLATTIEDTPGTDSGEVVREFKPEDAAQARVIITPQPQGG